MLISGINLGLKIKDKGYLKGFAYGNAIFLSMFILSFILGSEHSLYNIDTGDDGSVIMTR